MILVYRYRVKSLNGLLNKQSRAVNYVWNFCNDTQKHALKWGKKWPTGFDLNVLTTGSSKELGIHSGTVNATCEQYAKLHAKVANARADFQHKLAVDLVRRFDYIAVGNVSAVKLARTRMAKSVYDASWSSFRNKLRYKAIAHGATFEEVDESGSTQSCSACGSKDSTTRPKGIAGLRIREWACSGCGVVHDRDINAALNILRCGRASPGVGSLSL
ncbi:putative transposase DNA-binding domain protein [Burkholderia cenocepacia]|uniref:RNA-guided endonuclease InsQ/TnpB family protein n=1 Tax=Burkholderia cenocepacia TaxID=95486 RepID=UPI00163B95CE|nr:RNA-guided endonuclease TnpB family protein [Burkholderia cenocepacia]MBR8305335.1 transposase [Burkholderia cenocepacia]QND98168.1 putative transposase DNA-binding domain protein [Burkholderia cenocepacia]